MIRERSTKRNEYGLVRSTGRIKLQKQRRRKISGEAGKTPHSEH